MNVLVTGHRGYIGCVLVPRLQEAGFAVRGLDSGLFSDCRLTATAVDIPEQELDIRDVTAEHLRGVDAVLHLAAISNDPLGDLNPDVTLDINYHATVRLAHASREAGVRRFLYASSCSLYGAASPEDILDESAPFRPVTVYGRSKMLAERALAKLATPGFSPVFLRCATAYGMSPLLRGDLVVNNLVGHALTEQLVYMKSDGTPWRPLVHVQDICAAYLALLDAPDAVVHNRPFNVGRSTENYQVREVAECVRAAVPQAALRYADDAGPDRRCYRVSCRRLEDDVPGYRPQWTVADGVRELRDACLQIGLDLATLTGPATQRIQRIRQLQQAGLLDADLRWHASAAPAASLLPSTSVPQL